MYADVGFTRLRTSRHFRREKEKGQKPPPARTQRVHTKTGEPKSKAFSVDRNLTNPLVGHLFSKQGQFELEQAVRREVRGLWLSEVELMPASLQRELEITATVNALRAAWRRCPELRLGQLIANALPSTFGCDPFHIADEQLRDQLEKYRAKAPV
jgi:hypothetical protein